MLLPDSTQTAINVNLPTGTTPIEDQSLAEYGTADAGVREFVDKYRTASFKASCFEIRKDVGLGPENTFTDVQDFQRHVTNPRDELTQTLIITVDELSAPGLQTIGSFFGIHLDFLAWVTADDAADGYWLHNHNDGKTLCFDLPGIEFYHGPTLPNKMLLRDGRLKHLSSLHRFYGDENSPEGLLSLFANRRVSGCLLKHDDLPVFVCFREACQNISSVPLQHNSSDRIGGAPHRTFYEVLQEVQATDRDTFKGLHEDPACFIAILQRELLLSWHDLANRLQNDLEHLDDLLGDSTNFEVVPLYLDRDIAHMLERFVYQMEAHEGFVQHCLRRNQSTSHVFYPGATAKPVCIRVEQNSKMMQRRLRRLMKKVSSISTAMYNRVANQQACLATRQARLAALQAEASREMANLQRRDNKIALEQGQNVARLSFIATIYVPLSFAAVSD